MSDQSWGRIANPSRNNQRVKSAYFFAGDWRSGYNPIAFDGEPIPSPNDGLYTVHPSDGRHLGWSVLPENREFAVAEMVRAGLNTVVMSYWGEAPDPFQHFPGLLPSFFQRPGSDRWRYYAPMQTSPLSQDQLFAEAVKQNLLIMPVIESSAGTHTSPAFLFPDEFPPVDPANCSLTNQILDLIRRYVKRPQDQSWVDHWLQLYDQQGVPRRAIYIIDGMSNKQSLQPKKFQNTDDQHMEFAQGFNAIAHAVWEATDVHIGFVLDAATRPVSGGQLGDLIHYYPTSAYPACNPDASDALRTQNSVLAIQAYTPDGQLTVERSEGERVDLKRRYLENWAATGIPVFMDLTIGYDGHIVFQPGPHEPVRKWGNNPSWRTELLKIQPDAFPGVAFTTWNGYTEGYAVVPTTEFGEAAFRWVQRITRQWFDILPFPRFLGKTITALWQTSPFYLRLFVTDDSGSVWMTWWEPQREWTFWSMPTAPEKEIKMHPGAEVTAVWRKQNGHFDIFVTGTDGAVWTIWWNDAAGFRPEGWIELHREIRMFPGATVTAVWTTDQGQHLDLFVTGTDGAVWTIWWDDVVGWRPQGWIELHPEIKMFPGATVTAVWTTDQGLHLDLFVTGTDGAVWTTWFDNVVGWRPGGWLELHPEIRMQPGANVTAVWATPGKHLDLFVTGIDGAVWTTWFDDVVGWRPGGWLELHPEIKMRPGATVTAVWTVAGNHLDLFATDTVGVVWSIWQDVAGWRRDGWFVIGDAFAIGSGRTITAKWSPDPNVTHLDLYSIGASGQVVGAFWEPELGW